MQMTLAELAAALGAELRGDADLVITGVATLKGAGAGDISFLANPSYQSQLSSTAAGAVILRADVAESYAGAALIASDPYLCFARVTRLFDNRPKITEGVHPSAVVADSAEIAPGCRIGPRVVIGEQVSIGPGTEIGAGTVIGDFCVLGEGCHLNANVTLYHDVTLGDRVRIHSGAVIGADGFGFAPHQGRWEKIAQLGGVRIGNDVEIGANTCIDRGALEDTRIGDNVILDNLIQIAHNVELGEGTAAAAQSGIAGSTRLGKHCTLAGNAGIAGHLDICDGVYVAPKSVISKSIREPGGYATGTAQMPIKEWRKSATRFRQLDSLARRVSDLEKNCQATDTQKDEKG
ncbi:MAG TPA: UDP-3-O-(3-hydroxymyristoyl)glucosamine N-acyltransferase [Oceanospirillales bacterium]|nr:UDP-3-O-(3-hydroxymyristoyl)glucosamine N-acyltransferase [Oceanospirillaceae bacterium]HBS41223.1 UDP-3-O-(3-hydroxymyristoyl)glucosamine N-acyltransferase [Oceanospirillales bacterium]|tara:strand:+ start:1708 stop:2751 length:1044 start_codon:yes stop_codon:yes gene_type:complete